MLPFGCIFDIAGQRQRLGELAERAQDPALWQNAEKTADLQRERVRLDKQLNDFDALAKTLSDGAELLELAEADKEIAQEIDRSLTDAHQRIEALELQRMLGGAYDKNDAVLTINAGAGGTESQDWALMLQRMLLRWCERREYTVELLDLQEGEEAGIKGATYSVQGLYAYGYLKSESGVHRLVRISPFDAAKRRHTSFASVGVAPEISDDIHVEIREEDLRVDTYRSSGAGGQHVNKTDSAVRLTHLPSGLVVACQAERSQHKNRAKALKLLRARLFEIELRKLEDQRARLAGEKKKIEWGSQIRSYVLHPYRLVKDHRTGCEMGNADAVLDGQLDRFIEAYLLGKRAAPGSDKVDD